MAEAAELIPQLKELLNIDDRKYEFVEMLQGFSNHSKQTNGKVLCRNIQYVNEIVQTAISNYKS